MELAAAASATPVALWLNSFFSGYDYAILDFMNTLAVNAGGILTPIMKAVTFLGEKGIMFFLLAVILMLFPRTRKMGVCVFGAVCCGALISNIILKDMVERVRPFLDEANEHYMDYKSFWDAVGSPAEDGYSFPSGHVTAAAAGMLALVFTKGKKMIAPAILWIGLMMVSRNYLMAHYPSDVLFALIIGAVSALIAWGISTLIFNYFDDNDDFPLCNWVLTAELPISIPSLGELKDKASDSFDSIKDKASGISKPDIDLKAAGKKLVGDKFPAHETQKKKPVRKEPADWNSRWDDYQRSKRPQSSTEKKPAAIDAAEDDVKVFTGSKKPAPAKDGAEARAAAVKAENISAAPTKSAKKTSSDYNLDDWDDLTAFLNSDMDVEVSEKPRPEKSARTKSGEYKGRHSK